ncbi:hypothetical protein QFZ56_006156 [Streptomyces achromogenes]|uniref:Uncharacterized protein n=1 Tax=Streptomyces achromogenes TaxID=67255 RepID=A0ABU0QBP5_STRAH|nr:hypothetical protein [Streptomyces achromogenes]
MRTADYTRGSGRLALLVPPLVLHTRTTSKVLGALFGRTGRAAAWFPAAGQRPSGPLAPAPGLIQENRTVPAVLALNRWHRKLHAVAAGEQLQG